MRIFYTISFLLLFLSNCFTQYNNLRFKRLGLIEGLTHTNVQTIVQDKKGFMWFGTGNGLCQYDGYSIKKINLDASSVQTTTINFICNGNYDKLWVLTKQGVFCLNNTINSSKQLNVQNYKNENQPSYLYEDKKGRIWIGNSNNEITLLTKENQDYDIKNYRIKDDRDNLVSFITEDYSGNIWAATARLSKFDLLTQNFVEIPFKNKFVTSDDFSIITDIVTDSKGFMWLATTRRGLIKFDPRNNKMLQIPFDLCQKPDDDGYLDLPINALSFDINGKLWIGTLTSGIYIYDINTGNSINYRSNPDNPNSLSSNSILDLYQDRTGVMWIGTLKGGLMKCDLFQKGFIHYKMVQGDKKSLSDNNVTCFAEDQWGQIWIGTWNGGLNRFNPKTGVFDHFEYNPSNPKGLPSNNIGAIEEDGEGNLWILSWYGQISKLTPPLTCNPSNARFKKYAPNENIGLIGWGFRTLFCDPNGNIWVGSIDSGIFQINKDQTGRETFVQYKHDPKNINSISSNAVWKISGDHNGNLWISTENCGIDKFDPLSGKFTNYGSINSFNKNKLSSLLSQNVYEDTQGIIWVATNNGLNRLDPATGKVNYYTAEKDGLANNRVYGILEDGSNNLWISTENGLSKFNTRKGVFRNYEINDGLQSNEFNIAAFFKSKRTGQIFLGGPSGFNLFHPDSIKDNPNYSNVVLTGFKLFNKDVMAGDTLNGQIVLTNNISYTRKLILNHKNNVLSFEFAALHYAYPEKIKYEYKLEGFDKEWLQTSSTKRFANYTSLPPGEYLFRVKSTNNDGVWCDTKDETALQLIVLPPWWRTVWFRLFILSLTITLVYVWFQYRTHRLRLQKKVLEKKVDERTFELSQKNDELYKQTDQLQETILWLTEKQEEITMQSHILEENNEELILLNATKDKLFSIIAHDLKNPFVGIINLSETLYSDFSSLSDEKKKNFIKAIQKGSDEAYKLVDNLLEWAKVQSKNKTIEFSTFDLSKIIVSTFEVMQLNAAKKNIQILSMVEKGTFILAEPNMIATVIRNLLSNAIKFSDEGGRIIVSSREATGCLEICVKDHGTGMDQETLEKVFRKDIFHSSRGTWGEIGTGLGLKICKDFIEANNGVLSVESRPGNGTTFTFTLSRGVVNSSSIIDQQEKPVLEKMPIKLGSDDKFQEDAIAQLLDDRTILIVEDNENIRTSLANTLSKHYNISEAENGKQGMEKALNIMPDLIISDIFMPEMNGYEMCAKLKRDNRTCHIPIILLTARESNQSRIIGFEKGADEYLPKPFSIDVLETRIKNLINLRHELAQHFIRLLGGMSDEIGDDSPDDKFLKKVVELIEDNMRDEQFSVEKLAQLLNMNRIQLYRKLLALTNQSVSEFIMIVRINKAARLLIKSSLSIAEICYKVGFKYPSHFTKRFTLHFGVTPSFYREKHRSQ